MTRIKTFFERIHGEGAEANITSIMQAMIQSLMDAKEIEKPYRRALEKLAISLMLDQPEFAILKEPYEAGEFKIDAKLGVSGDLENAALSDAPDPEMEQNAAEELQGITDEILKRKVINALIAGGAVSKNYAYQLVNDKLNKIDPGLPTLYGMVMAGTELGYFAVGDEQVRNAVRMPGAVGGSAELKMGDVPVVKVRAMIFPMLVQELAKGLLELVSYEGLPKDPDKAKAVINKADLADEEAWEMIMGRGLWMRFVNAIGMDETDVTLNLYNYLIQLEPKEFSATMKTIQGGGPASIKLLKELAAQLRSDIEDEKNGPIGERPPDGGYREGRGGETDDDGGTDFGYGGDNWKNQ
jgi:hypothetical protein